MSIFEHLGVLLARFRYEARPAMCPVPVYARRPARRPAGRVRRRR